MNKCTPFLKILLGLFMGIWCLGGIILTLENPKTEFMILAVMSGIACYLLLRRPTSQNHVKPTTPYIEKDNIRYRSDNQLISDDEFSDLIQNDCEKALSCKLGSTNIKFTRTEHEENLCVQFMMNHGEEIEKHTKSFEDMNRLAYAEQDLNKQIELLQNTITLYEKERKWFYRTKGGTIYFQDYYEHQHNSKNVDFSYIDSVKDLLDYNLYKRDDVIPEIMQVITSSGELMQRDIYKYIPDISKSIIQQTIRELEKDNLIIRTKRGNSYLLSLGSCPYKV